MNFLKYFFSLFFIKKIKSKGTFSSITDWELNYIYDSIKKNNRMDCPNCENHYLISFKKDSENEIHYCEFCGQSYIFKKLIINNFSKLIIINAVKVDNLINQDVIRYKKLKKVINRNVYSNSQNKN